MTFSDLLRAERARLNLSQTECAALIPPLPVRTLQCWEIAQRTPPDWAQPLILAHLRRHKPRPAGRHRNPAKP